MFRLIRKTVYWGIIAASVSVLSIFYIYIFYFNQAIKDEQIHEMYKHLIAQTGQIQDQLPLVIVENPDVNAYTDGTKIVLYRGMIDYANNNDEIALVIGHEIAHGTLAHLNRVTPFHDGHEDDGTGYNDGVAVLEANADKLGAVYMMKAGYDVCEGRKIFLKWQKQYGNALGQTHPDFSYRFDELNIGCE